MTAMDFPDAPVPGQIYASPEGPIYRFEDPLWNVIDNLEDPGYFIADLTTTPIAKPAIIKLQEYVSVADCMHPSLAEACRHYQLDETSVAEAAVVVAAINDTIAGIGNGTVVIPRGRYPITYTTSFPSTPEDQRAAIIMKSSVRLSGEGRGNTQLVLADSSFAHCIAMPGLTAATVENMTIDGNRAANLGNGVDHGGISYVNGFGGILMMTTADRNRISNVQVRNMHDYGIGIEVGTALYCTLENIIVNDVGTDGVDFKNTNENSVGNVVNNLLVQRFGIQGGSTPNAGPASPLVPHEGYAGLDISGRLMASNIRIEQVGYNKTDPLSHRSGIRFHIRSDPGEGGQRSHLSNFWIEGSGVNATDGTNSATDDAVWGLTIFDERAHVINGHIENVGWGINQTQPGNLLSNITIRSCGTGFVVNGEQTSGGLLPPPAQCSYSNFNIMDCSDSAVRLADHSANNTFYGFHMYNNENGLNLHPGANFNRFIGGSLLAGPATASAIFGDIGSNRLIEIEGFKTAGSWRSLPFPVDAVASLAFSLPYDLDVTPGKDKCQLSLSSDTSEGDWAATCWVRDVGASDVAIKVNVTKASVNPGAQAYVTLTIVV